MSGDPKIRRWISANVEAVLFLGAAFVQVVASVVFAVLFGEVGLLLGLIAAVLWLVAVCVIDSRGPWLTPEERVAKLEREADEALAREIALLEGERPSGADIAKQAAMQAKATGAMMRTINHKRRGKWMDAA